MVDLSEYEALRSRPLGKAVLHMNWRHLLFLHYALDPGQLRPHVPKELEIDTFPDADGREKAWVGVIPFTMHGIRPRGMPALPGLSAFHETNLRTYVHARGSNPGVWFFSLDAANATACRVARTTFGLPYHHASMSLDAAGDRRTYRSERRSDGAALFATASIGQRIESAPGSFEFWLVERYALFAIRRGKLISARVHHPPYELWKADVVEAESTLPEASGLPIAPWAHACFSQGVDVEVFRPQPVVG